MHIDVKEMSKETLERVVSDLSKTIKELRNESEFLQQSLESSVSAGDDLGDRIVELSRENRQLKGEIQRGPKELKELKAKIAEEMLSLVPDLEGERALLVCGLVYRFCGERIKSIRAWREKTGTALKPAKDDVSTVLDQKIEAPEETEEPKHEGIFDSLVAG